MAKKQNLSFLDDPIENFKGDAIQLTATQKTLIDIAAQFADNVRENLNKADRNSSGYLADSTEPREPVINGKKISIEIETASYYDYVNSGVRGVSGGSGKYAFKYANPSKKMVAEIKKWVTKERIKFTDKSKTKVAINNTNGGTKSYKTSREAKRKAADPKTTAYVIARSIKKKGLKATGFWDDAVKELEKNVDDRLGDAVVIDILNSF